MKRIMKEAMGDCSTVEEFRFLVRCRECGRVFDVDMPYFSGLEDRITDKHGFDVDGHEIVFAGLCPGCKIKKTN